MLRAFGAKNVKILNGCQAKWVKEGRSVEEGTPKDVNDTSEEGYDYVLDQVYVDNYDTTFQKVAAFESKVPVSTFDLILPI